MILVHGRRRRRRTRIMMILVRRRMIILVRMRMILARRRTRRIRGILMILRVALMMGRILVRRRRGCGLGGRGRRRRAFALVLCRLVQYRSPFSTVRDRTRKRLPRLLQCRSELPLLDEAGGVDAVQAKLLPELGNVELGDVGRGVVVCRCRQHEFILWILCCVCAPRPRAAPDTQKTHTQQNIIYPPKRQCCAISSFVRRAMCHRPVVCCVGVGCVPCRNTI